MANDYAWFYNSENGDRKYDADSFSDWLRKFFTTGVFNGDLELSSNNDMSVSLSTGYANIGGKVRMFESVQNFTLDTADAQYDRIDTIVIERNDTDRDITAKLIKGQLSTNPEPTAPVRSGNIYQLVVAEIYVSAGAVRITDEQISDKRMDASVCGYVTGAVDQIDFDMAMQQFSAWFERVKGQLSEDAAGHLQNQIDDINDEIGDTDISEIGDGTVTGAISSLKNTTKWKIAGENSGSSNTGTVINVSLNLPNDFDEIMIFEVTGNNYCESTVMPKIGIDNTNKTIDFGRQSSMFRCQISSDYTSVSCNIMAEVLHNTTTKFIVLYK